MPILAMHSLPLWRPEEVHVEEHPLYVVGALPHEGGRIALGDLINIAGLIY